MSDFAPWLPQGPRTNIVAGPSHPVTPNSASGSTFAPFIPQSPPKFNTSGKPVKKWPTVKTRRNRRTSRKTRKTRNSRRGNRR